MLILIVAVIISVLIICFILLEKYIDEKNRVLLLLFCMLLIVVFDFFCIPDSRFSTSIIGDLGSLLCGVFTFITAVFLWMTFSEQRKQSKKQSEEFQKQLDLQEQQNKKSSIENHFYKMLEIARENSNNIESKGKTGRAVFFCINNEFEELYKIINVVIGSKFKSLDKIHIIQITWVLLFYGMDNKMKLARDAEISKILKTKNLHIEESTRQCIITIIEQKKLNKERYGFLPNGYLKYDGYQSILAHYYRHLYQIVVYINKQDILTYDEKYGYIKTLRAQLNVFELILLFYNTLSPYGRTWESNLRNESFIDNVDKYITEMGDNINNQLITKYQFFRNATMPLLGGKIKISDFYPMINYENATDEKDGITEQERDKLEAVYRKQDK